MNNEDTFNNQRNEDVYIDLYDRWKRVVNALSEKGKTEEAEYLMIQFFVFYTDVEELKKKIIVAEKMLRKREW